jgi:serine acetyltransferase/GT2 family glycosyltransferase
VTASALAATVVIATFNRRELVETLLGELSRQTLAPDRFEVVVVDDGSAEPVGPALARLSPPYELTVVRQENAGPAAARHRGIMRARGGVIIVVDDDVRIDAGFVAAHLSGHAGEARRVVLGRLLPVPGTRPPLFERYQAALLDRQLAALRDGRDALRGLSLYTGNVSFRRADYLSVGGFDPAFRVSEDAELGIRLEQAGCTFQLSESASAFHASDHTSLDAWVRRSLEYGVTDSRIAEKHPRVQSANPWRFLFLVNPVSRPLLLSSALMPRAGRVAAALAMRAAGAFSSVRAERVALAGATLAYGLLYFSGVGAYAGSSRAALQGLAAHLRERRDDELGPAALAAKMVADLRADHAAMRRGDAKYGAVERRGSLLGDAVTRVGFQMMIAYRMMRWLRGTGLRTLARIASRLIRHLYGAELHWDAELAPGVVIVHGTGLVLSQASRVGSGCVLFHGVTLGWSIHPETRAVGAPVLEADVHVGPGATLLGPITIGRGTKISAASVLMQSVPAQSIVQAPAPHVRIRPTPVLVHQSDERTASGVA